MAEAEELLKSHCAELQLENEQLKCTMEKIQESLIELQRGEDDSRGLATIDEEDSFFGVGSDLLQPPGLTGTSSDEKSGPQPFTGWGMTADSVK